MFTRASCWVLLSLGIIRACWATDAGFVLKGLSLSNAQPTLQFELYPAAQQYRVFTTDRLGMPFREDLSGSFAGDLWTAPGAPGEQQHFFQGEVVPLDP